MPERVFHFFWPSCSCSSYPMTTTTTMAISASHLPRCRGLNISFQSVFPDFFFRFPLFFLSLTLPCTVAVGCRHRPLDSLFNSSHGMRGATINSPFSISPPSNHQSIPCNIPPHYPTSFLNPIGSAIVCPVIRDLALVPLHISLLSLHIPSPSFRHKRTTLPVPTPHLAPHVPLASRAVQLCKSSAHTLRTLTLRFADDLVSAVILWRSSTRCPWKTRWWPVAHETRWRRWRGRRTHAGREPS